MVIQNRAIALEVQVHYDNKFIFLYNSQSTWITLLIKFIEQFFIDDEVFTAASLTLSSYACYDVL